MGLIGSLLLGALIGWIASRLMGSRGGLLRNILLGVIGSGVGHWAAGLLGIYAVGVGGLLISVAGACLVILICRKLF